MIQSLNGRDGTEDTYRDKRIDGRGDRDWAYAIAFSLTDEVYIAGFGGNLPSGHSSYDSWIKKFSISGEENTEGNIYLGLSMESRDDCLRYQDGIQACEINGRNDLIVAGYCERERGESGFVCELDKAGAIRHSIIIDDADKEKHSLSSR